MGHYYGGMLDTYSDLTLQCACFGGHIETIEVDELAALREGVTEADIARREVEAALRRRPVGTRADSRNRQHQQPLSLPLGVRAFMHAWNRQGPAHHCATGAGHIGTKLEKLAALLELECVRVC